MTITQTEGNFESSYKWYWIKPPVAEQHFTHKGLTKYIGYATRKISCSTFWKFLRGAMGNTQKTGLRDC